MPMTSCPASCSRPAVTLLSTPPDMATTTRMSALRVAGRGRQLDHQSVKLVRHDNLAPKARGPGQTESQIEHVFLILCRRFQLLEPGPVDDYVAGRTRERALASTFYVHPVLVGDFQHREPQGRVNLAMSPITLNESHSRHADQALVRG